MDKKGNFCHVVSIIGIVLSTALLLSTISHADTDQYIFGGARGNVEGVTSAMQTYISNNGLIDTNINSVSQIKMDASSVMSRDGGSAITVQQYSRQSVENGLLTNMVSKYHGTNIKEISFISTDGTIDRSDRLDAASYTNELAFAANNRAIIDLTPAESMEARGILQNAGYFQCVSQILPKDSSSESDISESKGKTAVLPDVSFENLYQVYEPPSAESFEESLEERRDQIPSSYEISFVADGFMKSSADESMISDEVNAMLECYYLLNNDNKIDMAGYDFKGYAEFDDVEFESGMTLFVADPMGK